MLRTSNPSSSFGRSWNGRPTACEETTIRGRCTEQVLPVRDRETTALRARLSRNSDGASRNGDNARAKRRRRRAPRASPAGTAGAQNLLLGGPGRRARRKPPSRRRWTHHRTRGLLGSVGRSRSIREIAMAYQKFVNKKTALVPALTLPSGAVGCGA